jgi:hypothetical protein
VFRPSGGGTKSNKLDTYNEIAKIDKEIADELFSFNAKKNSRGLDVTQGLFYT